MFLNYYLQTLTVSFFTNLSKFSQTINNFECTMLYGHVHILLSCLLINYLFKKKTVRLKFSDKFFSSHQNFYTYGGTGSLTDKCLTVKTAMSTQ